MFCENIYHICQHRCYSLNTNNIKTDRCTPKREYLPVHLPVYRKRIRDASRYTIKKISLKLLFLSDIFLFPFIRQQVTVLA